MITEIFYLGHDNTIDLLLKADGEAVDLSPVTRIDLEIKNVVTISSTSYPDVIRWTGLDVTGKVIISLDDYDGELPVGKYRARLVVYDPTNTDGIVWGDLLIQIRS